VPQGFTGGNATFWVGANALIRRRALDDIKETRLERGYPVQVFIQDKTLIEDTESSIDLIRAGWTLYNHPARLAYSATPPDFGSLLIQRHRWANGGLLILGKLFAYAWRAPKNASLLREFSLRFHYLASLAGGSAATLLLFFYPFSDRFNSALIPLSAVPYFVLYARDLGRSGYRYTDVVRIYALNMALLPVIVGGVLSSLHQGLTGAKLPFARTPKVATRSAAPPMYAAIELLLPIAFFVGCGLDAMAHRWSHGAFGLLNGALFLYALIALLGFRDTVFDATASLRQRPVADPAPAPPVSIEAEAAPMMKAPMRQAESSVLVGE
jgi:hypothetical protein